MSDVSSKLELRASQKRGPMAEGRRGRAVRRRRGGLGFALVAAMAMVLIWGSGATAPGASSRSTPSTAPQAQPASSALADAEAPSPTASIRALQGRALAVAWLHGYLTRSSRDDDRWEAAIADLSTPELVDELRKAGPDNVGLGQLNSWRVARIRAYTAVDQPVETPSRTVLAYAAVVTDGHRTVEKPFTLYAYRQGDNRWRVTLVDQPYSSEG